MNISCKNNPQDYARFVAQVMPLGKDYHWLLSTLYTAVNENKMCRIRIENPITLDFTIDSDGTLEDVILHTETDSNDCSADLIFNELNAQQKKIFIEHIGIDNVEENSMSRPGSHFKYYIWHKVGRGCVSINVNDRK